MIKNAGHIKNPLTVISVFAGITEISGTVVLPFIDADSQSIYIWFLMLFPTLLVGVFFATLNWNHKTLYAPSDYQNEDNFISSISRSTKTERVIKLTEEVNEVVLDTNETTVLPAHLPPESAEGLETPEVPEVPPAPVAVGNPEKPVATTQSIPKENLINPMHYEYPTQSKNINIAETKPHYYINNLIKHTEYLASTFERNRLSADIKLTEELAIKKISKITGKKFDRGMKLRTKDGGSILFDAANLLGNHFSAIEVKLFRDGKFNRMRILKVLEDCQSILTKDEYLIDNFTLHLVVVINIEKNKKPGLLELIRGMTLSYSFDIHVHLLTMNELEQETQK